MAEAEGLSFLARRWGSDVERIRWSITDQQFLTYVQIERKAMLDERAVVAYGSYAAVADAIHPLFSKTRSKPKQLKDFVKRLGAGIEDERRPARPATPRGAPESGPRPTYQQSREAYKQFIREAAGLDR